MLAGCHRYPHPNPCLPPQPPTPVFRRLPSPYIAFGRVLSPSVTRFAGCVYVAKGIIEWKERHNQDVISSDIQGFLDRFYTSRIGIRIMIGQHVALGSKEHRPDYVGIICTRTNLAQICTTAPQTPSGLPSALAPLPPSPLPNRLPFVSCPSLSSS